MAASTSGLTGEVWVFFDLPLDRLWNYRVDLDVPADFDEFWAHTLEETAAYPLDVTFEPHDAHLTTVDVADVSFRGFGGDVIRGWLLTPAGADGPLPVVVEYIGYGGGRGLPVEWMAYSGAGFAHLVMDTRGQGGVQRPGATPDRGVTGPAAPGFLARGIEDRYEYYYRRVYVDAVRAVAAAGAHPKVDADRVAVVGRSQGGGIALAVAGLVRDVDVMYAQTPFLCAVPRAVEVTDSEPYGELTRWCAAHRDGAAAFRTLAYFDGVAFASRANCHGYFTAALMDTVCPPSTVFAAHNCYAGPREMKVWHYNGHEGGGALDTVHVISVLRARWLGRAS